jgi:hypothetical protein
MKGIYSKQSRLGLGDISQLVAKVQVAVAPADSRGYLPQSITAALDTLTQEGGDEMCVISKLAGITQDDKGEGDHCLL